MIRFLAHSFAAAAIATLVASPAWAVTAPAPKAPLVAPSTPISPEQFVSEITKAVTTHYNLEGDLQIELLRPWTPPKETAATWQVTIEEFPIAASSTMVLRCRVFGDGASLFDQPVMVRASLMRDSWFARQPIPSGTVFSSSLLEVRKIDCMREHDSLPASAGSSSFIFSHDMQPDRLVTWRDLARRPLVHKGETVEVVATEGMLSLTMKALALENGAKGDLVSVRNLESNKNISGEVIDDGRVLIHF